jgi:gliding motility-associated-like protein
MSHKDFENIEELFRSGLEDMEVPVNDAMWSSISKGISASATSTGTAAAAKGGSSLMTYLGLAGTACVVGVVGTLLYTSFDKEVVFDQVLKTEVSAPQINQTNEVTHLTEVTTDTNIDAVPASQEDRNIIEEIVQPSSTEDPVVTDQSDPVKTVVVVEDEPHSYGDSWVEYFLTPSNGSYTEPITTTETTSEVTENTVKPTIEEIEENEIVASIVAAPVGGYAPLEVSFAQYSEKGNVTWDFGDGTITEETNPTHIFEKYGEYKVTLTITDADGNTFTDVRTIEVMANSALTKIPNVFTPNMDGANDVYRVEGKNIEEFNMAILNTQGEILYQSNAIDQAWDGKDRFGNDLPVGTYVVIIKAQGIDGKMYEHSGTVTLNR